MQEEVDGVGCGGEMGEGRTGMRGGGEYVAGGGGKGGDEWLVRGRVCGGEWAARGGDERRSGGK